MMRSRTVICIGIRRGAYPRARFREAEQIARKGDVARMNDAIPYRYLPPHSFRMPDKRCLSLRQSMTVFGFFGGGLLSIRAGAWIRAPTAENDRFRFFGGALLSIRAGAWIRAPTRLAVGGGEKISLFCEIAHCFPAANRL